MSGRPISEITSACAFPHAGTPLLDTEALLSVLPGMVYRCRQDENRTLLYASANTERLTGYDTEELMSGRRVRFSSLIHSEDRVHVLKALDAAVASGQSYRLNYRIICADGVQKWVWDQGAAVRDPAGRIIALEGYVFDTTQARDSSAALQVSEARLRSILNAEPESVHIASLDGRLLDINPAGLRLCGAADMADVYERCVFDSVHEDDREAYRALHQAAAAGSSGVLEFRARGLDGRLRWQECHMAPLHDADGIVTTVLGLTRDVSAMKRAVQIEQWEGHITSLISQDAELGHVLEQVILGLEALLPDTLGSVMVADDDGLRLRHGAAPKLPSSYTTAVDGLVIGPTAGSCGTAAFLRRQVIVSDIANDPLWAEYQGLALTHDLGACWSMPIMNASGAVLGTFGMYRRYPSEPQPGDLELVSRATRLVGIAMQRERQAMELRQSEERFRRTFADAAIGMAIMSPDGRFLAVNRACCDTLEYTEAELLARNSGSVTHPEDRASSEVRLQELADGTRKSDVFEKRYVSKSGRIITCRASVAALCDSQGRAISNVVVLEDLSERLAAEERLRHAQRLESVGQLTGGVAHDFNNLLTVIQGNAELLCEHLALDPVLQPLADMIYNAAENGASLTRHLLAFARRQPLQPRPVAVNELMLGMNGMLRRVLGEHIEVDMVCDTDLRQAMIDPGQLENAVLNLCINARDAMPQGGSLTIETANVCLDQDYVSAHQDLQPGPYVMVAVSDTGCGIAQEHLGKVFEPFFTTKDKGKGTGLGLSMVFGFIKQSGGHVSVYSETGHGTTLRMYLPHAVDGKDTTPQAVSDDTVQGRGERVLVVEDDDMVRQFVCSQLERLGYRVISAENGPAALAILQARDDVDLLFTDVVMPGGMTGRVLANAAQILHPRLRVLYTSGYTENAIVHHGRLDEGVSLLSKPYRRAELARKIRDVLRGAA